MTDKTLDDDEFITSEYGDQFDNFIDKTKDVVIDLTSNSTSRAGHTVHRVLSLREGNVHDDVIALQLTKNSASGYTYEGKEIETIAKIGTDSRTKVVITAAQTRKLKRDQSGR